MRANQSSEYIKASYLLPYLRFRIQHKQSGFYVGGPLPANELQTELQPLRLLSRPGERSRIIL